MMERPHAEQLNSNLSGDLEKDIEVFRQALNCPENQDVTLHRFLCPGFEACLIFIEGMASGKLIGELILRAAQFSDTQEVPAPDQRAVFLREKVLCISQAETEQRVEALVRKLLGGMTVLLADGCAEGVCLETRGFVMRPVGRTQSESAVSGSQEGFVEGLRANLTLLHRYVQSSQLVVEFLDVGTRVPTQLAVVHLKGVADEAILAELKRRLKCIEIPALLGIGQVQQLIEDHPCAFLPQMLQTERPDRAASCLLDGQIAVFADNSPYALIAPVTVFHLLHAADDALLRWQYGTFLRLIRMLGILFSLYLPAFYIALTQFHAHLIPMTLLTSIAETRARVPFPVVIEVLLMESSFYLINEAGTRMPSQIGSALGIVGALILGQAAVSASIISPILIIIIALTGLGNYSIPNYPFSLGIILYRLALEASAAVWGFYGIMLASFVIFCQLSAMKSLGQPYLAPASQRRPHNPDLLLRLPLRWQRKPLFYVPEDSWIRAGKPLRRTM